MQCTVCCKRYDARVRAVQRRRNIVMPLEMRTKAISEIGHEDVAVLAHIVFDIFLLNFNQSMPIALTNVSKVLLS